MNQLQSTTLLNDLLQQDAASVLAWLRNIESDLLKPPFGFKASCKNKLYKFYFQRTAKSRFHIKNCSGYFYTNPNWLGLAEGASFEAQSASDLAWAEVAISVYERLAAEANSSAQESLMISAMLLRVSMIARLGSVPGHLVLDLDQIIRWFRDRQMMSCDSVAKKAANWHSCNIEEIRELRRIKNPLGVISILADSDKYVLNSELKNWLSLREKLP